MVLKKRSAVQTSEGPQPPRLKGELSGWQIFFIATSATIGTGLFNFDGLALNAAGPVGYLIATLVVGTVAIGFMDGLSEMIQVFPCTNALIHFVRVFVDKELAICVGWAYWASWSCLVAIQIAGAAEFMSSWVLANNQSLDMALRALLFYTICPLLLYFINTRHVKVFGWIESISGAFKLVFTFVLGLCLYYLAGQIEVLNHLSRYTQVVNGYENLSARDTYLDQPFAVWSGTKAAVSNVFAVVSLVAFSWIGIDIVAVTAFEASDPKHLRQPSQRISYVILIVYLVFGFGSAMSVDPLNSKLAHLYTPGEVPLSGNVTRAQNESVLSNASAIVTIAAEQVGNNVLGGLSNGFLIFSALSASNACLYTASRTLYGLVQANQKPRGSPQSLFRTKFEEKVLHVNSETGAPNWAIRFSLGAFIWLPWLGLIGLHRGTKLTGPINMTAPAAIRQFLNIAASTATIFVWGAHCGAFIRYYNWLKLHRDSLKKPEYRHLDRWAPLDFIDAQYYYEDWESHEHRGSREQQRQSSHGESRQSTPPLQGDSTADHSRQSTSPPRSPSSLEKQRASTWLGGLQPVPAWVGMVGCGLIVLIFPAAALWADSPSTPGGWAFNVFQIYSAPLLILVLWLILKYQAYQRCKKFEELWIQLDDKRKFETAIRDLNFHSQQYLPQQRHSPTRLWGQQAQNIQEDTELQSLRR